MRWCIEHPHICIRELCSGWDETFTRLQFGCTIRQLYRLAENPASRPSCPLSSIYTNRYTCRYRHRDGRDRYTTVNTSHGRAPARRGGPGGGGAQTLAAGGTHAHTHTRTYIHTERASEKERERELTHPGRCRGAHTLESERSLIYLLALTPPCYPATCARRAGQTGGRIACPRLHGSRATTSKHTLNRIRFDSGWALLR